MSFKFNPFTGNFDDTSTPGGGGTVTSVGTGTGLTGGPITTSGTIDLADTAVTPGSYTSANITVDQQGRITAAANGTAGANTTLSNLSSPTAVNQNILPDTTNTRSIGDSTTQFTTVFARGMTKLGAGGPGTTMTIQTENRTSGTSANVQLTSGSTTGGGTTSGSMTIATGSPGSNGGSITLLTSNATAGNSGNIILSVGTASGTRGKIKFTDGSEGTAGHVWTSSDTAGNGYWAAVPASGANTALSNLTTTSINQNLLSDTPGTRTLGTTGNTWQYAFLDGVKDNSNNLVLDISNRLLKDSSSVNSIDFENRILKDSTNVDSVNYEGRTLRDSTPETSIDYGNRKLYATGGVDIADWSNTNYLNAFTAIHIGQYTANFIGQNSYGVAVPQGAGVNAVNFSTKDHSTNSTDTGKEVNLITGDKLGASSTGNTGPIYVSTGINEGSGDSGFVALYTGYMGGAGNSGNIINETGLADTGNSGNVNLTSGNSNSGNSGNIVLNVGTAGGTQGSIKFLKMGVPSVSGQVWTASSTDGTGYWATPTAVPVNKKETFVLSAGDITNQYIDLTQVAKTDSINFMVKGSGSLLEGASYDYSVSYTGGAGGKTRITFLNDLATGGGAALVATDVVQVQYEY